MEDGLSEIDLKWLDAYVGEANFKMVDAERLCGRKHTTYNAMKKAASDMFFRLKPYIAMWMDAVGLSNEQIFSKLMQKWDAQTVTKVYDMNGIYVTEYSEDNDTVQMKALEFALRIKGLLNDKVPSDVDRLIELELARIAAARQS